MKYNINFDDDRNNLLSDICIRRFYNMSIYLEINCLITKEILFR